MNLIVDILNPEDLAKLLVITLYFNYLVAGVSSI